MRAAGLVAALIAAHVLAVGDRQLPASAWLPSALLWHDVAVAAGFWVIDRATRESRWTWIPYWILVAWSALNVPVARALATPLTMPMLRAADGPLLDSIAHYVTPANVGAMAVVILIAAAAPALLPRIPVRIRAAIALATIILAAAGPTAATRVDVRGLERNGVTAILTTLWPRIAAAAATADWRASPFETRVRDDLSRFRGLAQGRNVVVITLESTGARYLRPYGAALDPMPTISKLTQHAIVFDAAYAVYPESIKGLFAAMCSRSPGVDIPPEQLAQAPCDALASQFSVRGYRTALFHSGRFGYLGMDAVIASQGFQTLADAGAIGGQVRSSFGVDEPSTAAAMLRWIDERPGSPFLLNYMPIAGHHPYATPAPGPFKVVDEQSAYLNALHYADTAVATLMAGIEERGLAAKTLFVIFGDHGEAFGQHDGNFGHSFFLYDENIRVPLVIAMPGLTTAGVRVTRLASVVDIAPTILDLAGAPVPASYEGRSLLAPDDRMALFFTDYSLTWLGLRDGCWKYMVRVDSSADQLYDVCRDADERDDRASAERRRADVYRAHLRRWSGAVRNSLTATSAR